MTKKANKRLTPQQLKLVDTLLTHDSISVTQAGIIAGYSKKNAGQTASKALAAPHVQEYYQKQLLERGKRTGIDADYVLRRLSDIDQMDVGDLFDEHGKILDVKLWPKIWRQMVKKVDLKTGRIELPDKIRNIELIGKHVGVRAFAEQIEVTDTTGIAERLAKAKRRVQENADK